jgi:Zn-dependent hydrolases, including glyoxylases
MVKVERIIGGELSNNTYICYENGSGFLVDPTGDADVLDKKISELGMNIEAVLLTHGHFDHAMLAKYYQDKGIKVYIHKLDAEKLSTHKNLALMMGLKFPYLTADVMFSEDNTFVVAGIKIQVIHTPGHSSGSVCYVVPAANCIFSGDLIFKLSYGRTDFYDGDFDELVKSFQKIFALKGDYTVYTGHGDVTTLNYERQFNELKLEAEGRL